MDEALRESRGASSRRIPLMVDLTGRRCLVVGGGPVAAERAEQLCAAGARPHVVAREVSPAMEALAGRGRVMPPQARSFQPDDAAGCTVVVAATDDPEVNAAVAAAADRAGALCNVAGGGAPSTASIPAALRRGRLTIAVSTDGASPRLARLLRERLEPAFPAGWDELVELIAELRAEIEAAPAEQRDAGLRRMVDGIAVAALGRDGARERVRDHLRREVAA